MDGKLQRIIQLWQTDQKNHSPVPGVHLKVEQDLQVVKDSIFDIVRFIDDDNWCLPLIQGKAVDLLLDDVKVFSLPVGWLCAQGCGEIPVEIIHCMMGKDQIALLLILMKIDSPSSVRLAMPSRRTNVMQTELLLENNTASRYGLLKFCNFTIVCCSGYTALSSLAFYSGFIPVSAKSKVLEYQWLPS